MEISHKKLKVNLTLPDTFTGKHYIAYSDEMDKAADKYNKRLLLQSYQAGLAICTAATWDGKDLKNIGLEDVPGRVIKCVSDKISEYIQKEMAVPEE